MAKVKQPSIGKRLRRLRLECGLSQWALANRVGVTNQCISLIENEKKYPSYQTFSNIMRELNADANDFI